MDPCISSKRPSSAVVIKETKHLYKIDDCIKFRNFPPFWWRRVSAGFLRGLIFTAHGHPANQKYWAIFGPSIIVVAEVSRPFGVPVS